MQDYFGQTGPIPLITWTLPDLFPTQSWFWWMHLLQQMTMCYITHSSRQVSQHPGDPEIFDELLLPWSLWMCTCIARNGIMTTREGMQSRGSRRGRRSAHSRQYQHKSGEPKVIGPEASEKTSREGMHNWIIQTPLVSKKRTDLEFTLLLVTGSERLAQTIRAPLSHMCRADWSQVWALASNRDYSVVLSTSYSLWVPRLVHKSLGGSQVIRESVN